MFIALLQLFVCLVLLIVVSKYVLIKALRVLGESLSLSPKIVGEIAGFATSLPELLTVTVSAFAGLIDTGVYNILSSNIINTAQYGASVAVNKNTKTLKAKPIRVDLFLVALTILIPFLMILFKVQTGVITVPILLVLLVVFYVISNRTHKHYSATAQSGVIEDATRDDAEDVQQDVVDPTHKWRNVLLSSAALLLSGVLLYLICGYIGGALTTLATIFHTPELVLGIILGFATSVPELIHFFEAQRHHHKGGHDQEGMVEVTSHLLMSNVINLFLVLALGTLIYHLVS